MTSSGIVITMGVHLVSTHPTRVMMKMKIFHMVQYYNFVLRKQINSFIQTVDSTHLIACIGQHPPCTSLKINTGYGLL